MTTRIASCSCGALTARCEGEPVRISVCHCLACQRRTGSAFGVQARFPADQVVVEGDSHEWVRVGDEGSHGRFRFCPICGAIVFWSTDENPGFFYIPVGAFADPAFPAPRVAVYEERQHPWLALTEPGMEHFA